MSERHFLELKVPPPVALLMSAGLMWLVSRALPGGSVALPARVPAALATAAASGMLALPGIVAFLRAGTTIHPEKPERATRLVTTGVYSFTRNPMYLSLLLLLVSWALYLAHIAAAAVVPFFLAYIDRFQIRPEERALAKLFGSEYEDYCRRVRRWL